MKPVIDNSFHDSIEYLGSVWIYAQCVDGYKKYPS